MTKRLSSFGLSLLLFALSTVPLYAGKRETKTVEAAAEAVRELSAIPLNGIPRGLLHNAAGVAVIPRVIRAGLLIDREFGRGVVLIHEPDGRWSNPIFVTLSGGGIGGQAGIESTDLVLVFKTKKSLDRALGGRLTLGGDVSIAAGPLGREVEAAGDGRLLAEIYTYSHSRGLFLGVSFQGSRLQVDPHANEAFYGIRGGRPAEVLAHRGVAIGAAEALKAQLLGMSTPLGVLPVGGVPFAVPVPAPVVAPPPPVPLPPQPVPLPPWRR